MRMSSKISRWVSVAALVGMLMSFSLSASASAHTGEFAKFNYCPSTTSGVAKCLYSVTGGGTFILGKKEVPIVNPVTLQGGVSAANSEHVSTFYGATNGETLSKTGEPVPGGLAGLVNCDKISEPIAKLLCGVGVENGLTGVNATLELALPASEIEVSEYNLTRGEGVALKLPVKVHLENPFLGSACYVGSSSSPLILNLTTGTTEPPAPNKPITGKDGKISFKEHYEIVEIAENELVENAWSAPAASGCGGALSLLIDPILDEEVGLPSAAGHNTAILQNTIDVAAAESVNEH